MISSDPLKPDYDDEADFLPSFPSIRRRTIETLYPKTNAVQRPDKSPKGSVDAPIQRLVDLINQHPSFATLSSCSGRISLFDPQLKFKSKSNRLDPASSDNDVDVGAPLFEERINSGGESGKGSTGGWLLASHDVINPCHLLELLPAHPCRDSSDDHPTASSLLTFKFEPMLLHVAAANLDRGQQFLQLVLKLGFRESGLVVTKSRVTVAVRSYSLALNVPLARGHYQQGMFRPPDSYLTGLAEEANRRLTVNLSRIDNLYSEILKSLFLGQQPPQLPQSTFTIQATTRLPDLNLWNSASIAVVDEQNENASILSFGGYGEGPSVLIGQSDDFLPRSCKRSDAIYQLQRRGGVWDSCWERLEPVNNTKWKMPVRDFNFGIDAEGAQFSAREGAACCILTPFSPKGGGVSLIALFGGRKSPAHPLDDLLLFEYSSNSLSIGKPVDIRGDRPLPRWGHSLTSLSGSEGKLAVLYGGRNETTVHSTIHILSLVYDDNSGCQHLAWELLVTVNPIPPRFHHAGVIADDNKDQVLVVFGGLSTANDLLESFSSRPSFDSSECLDRADVFSINLFDTPSTQITRVVNSSTNDSRRYWDYPRFGHRASVMAMRAGGDDVNDNNVESPLFMVVALSGGVLNASTTTTTADDEAEYAGHSSPIQLFQVARTSQENPTCSSAITTTTCNSYPFEWAPLIGGSMETVDFGSLVHHNACVVPCSSVDNKNTDTGSGDRSCCLELVLTGGGVLGFGFRPCFAKSYALTVSFSTSCVEETWCSSLTFANSASATNTNNDCNTNTATIKKEKEPNYNISNENSSTNSNSNNTEQHQQHHHHQQPEMDVTAVPVLFVCKQNAKTLKTLFEEWSWLDKRYRMAPATAAAVAAMTRISSSSNDGKEHDDDDDDPASSGYYGGHGVTNHNLNESILLPAVESVNTHMIAVPVTNACLEQLLVLLEKDGIAVTTPDTTTAAWKTLVLGYGRQQLPHSTATYAKHGSTRKKNNYPR